VSGAQHANAWTGLLASILAPKNPLLDFGGDFAEPLFGFFRFITIKTNLSF
jgi:hypothetical protein